MRINLYDNELNRIAFVDENFISCYWKENYNSPGKLTLELPATEEFKRSVKPDYYVGRWDRATLMVIKSVTVEENKITCTGETADRQLADVAYIGTINDNVITAAAIKNAYEKTEKYPLFTIADSDLKNKYPSQISNKTVGELLQTMCGGADLGYKAVKVGKEIQIQFYCPGVNPNLKFSKDYGNLQDFSFFHSTAALKNYAIILGAGEGERRAKAEVDIRSDKTEQKRTVIIDAKDIQMEQDESEESYKQKLIARGIEKLLDYQTIKEVDFTPIYTYGVDFEIGDIITALLNDYGVKIQSRVMSVAQKQQNNKIETTIELGAKTTRTSTSTKTSGSTAGGISMLAAYPVGAIYLSVNSTSPETLFGGKWERLKDRFLLAAGDSYAAGSTGGEAKHTLTIDEMPAHSHTARMPIYQSDATIQTIDFILNTNARYSYQGGLTVFNHVAGFNMLSGDDQPHNNMPPYLAVYMWKRIA